MLIHNNYVQAAIISKLKADATLMAWLLTEGTPDEIREVYWQGVDFNYPAVRVSIGTQRANGESDCNADLSFTVYSYTEGDSSQKADELAGLVSDALNGARLTSGSGWESGGIIADTMVHAIRTGQRIWRATSTFRMTIYET